MSDQNNYPFMQFQPANPTQAFGQGYGIGQAFQANQQAADAKIAAQRQAEQYQQLYARAMSPTSTKQDWDALIINTPPDKVPAVKVAYEQRVADQEAQLAAAQQSAISEAYNNLQESGGGIEEYNELLSLIPPDQLETAKEAFNALSLGEQENVVKETVQVISMIRSGNAEMAAEAVQSWADAERADGNEQDALYHEQMVRQILAGDESASIVEQNLRVGLGMAGALGEDINDVISNIKDGTRADLLASYEKKRTDIAQESQDLSVLKFKEEAAQNAIGNTLATRQQDFTEKMDRANYELGVEEQALNERKQDYYEMNAAERLAFDRDSQRITQSRLDLDREKEVFDQEMELLTTGQAIEATPEEILQLKVVAELAGQDNAMKALQYAIGRENTDEDLNGRDPLSEADVFRMTKQLRDEFNARTKGYQESRLVYNKMQASVASGSGAGDVATIFQFMKMLDENSVVRESEYAAAKDTAGLYTLLQNTIAGYKEGDKLQPEQRERFLSLAKDYMDAWGAYADEVETGLRIVTDNPRWGIDGEEVFGPGVDIPAGFEDVGEY